MIQNLVKYFVHNCKHQLTSPPFSCIRHSRQTRGKGRYICWHVPAESHGWTGGGRRDGDSVIVMRNIFLGRSFTNFTDTSKYHCHEMENTSNINIVKRILSNINCPRIVNNVLVCQVSLNSSNFCGCQWLETTQHEFRMYLVQQYHQQYFACLSPCVRLWQHNYNSNQIMFLNFTPLPLWN